MLEKENLIRDISIRIGSRFNLEENIMAFKVTESAEKTTPAKKTIAVTDVKVSELRFIDEIGDITEKVVAELPKGIETVSFKITVELPNENE